MEAPIRSSFSQRRTQVRLRKLLVTVCWKLQSVEVVHTTLCLGPPNPMASNLWTQTNNLSPQQVGYIRERERESPFWIKTKLSEQMARMRGQSHLVLLVTQKQSLSSKGAGLGRTANSPVYEASLNSQFIGMMPVCHYMILLLMTKQHLRTQDKTKGKQAEANHQGHKPQREH